MKIISTVKLGAVDAADFITELKIFVSTKGGVLQSKFGSLCFISIFSVISISSASVRMEKSFASSEMFGTVVLKTVLFVSFRIGNLHGVPTRYQHFPSLPSSLCLGAERAELLSSLWRGGQQG